MGFARSTSIESLDLSDYTSLKGSSSSICAITEVVDGICHDFVCNTKIVENTENMDSRNCKSKQSLCSSGDSNASQYKPVFFPSYIGRISAHDLKILDLMSRKRAEQSESETNRKLFYSKQQNELDFGLKKQNALLEHRISRLRVTESSKEQQSRNRRHLLCEKQHRSVECLSHKIDRSLQSAEHRLKQLNRQKMADIESARLNSEWRQRCARENREKCSARHTDHIRRHTDTICSRLQAASQRREAHLLDRCRQIRSIRSKSASPQTQRKTVNNTQQYGSSDIVYFTAKDTSFSRVNLASRFLRHQENMNRIKTQQEQKLKEMKLRQEIRDTKCNAFLARKHESMLNSRQRALLAATLRRQIREGQYAREVVSAV